MLSPKMKYEENYPSGFKHKKIMNKDDFNKKKLAPEHLK